MIMTTSIVIGLLSLLVVIVFIFMAVPVGFLMAFVGLIGLWINGGLDVMLNAATVVPYSAVAKGVLLVLPLFILMGHFAAAGGYVDDFFVIARKWFGSLKGGVAIATMATCTALGAVSASTVASAGLMAKVAIPPMLKMGYDRKLAAGTVVMGGTLSALIPPSLGLVFYAVLTDVSIGKLFIAGIGPGLLTSLVWIVTIYLICSKWPNLAPPAPSYPWKEKFVALKDSWPIVFLVVIVLGGLYAGIFTPTEAGAVGSVGTLALLFIKRQSTWSNIFKEGVFGVSRLTGSIFLIICGVTIYSTYLATSGTTLELTKWFISLPVSRWFICAGFLVLYLILGCFIDALGMMAITLPLNFPVMMALGFDPLWWGIMVQKLMEIGLATPPFGINVFTVKSVASDIPLQDVFTGTLWFLLAEIPILTMLALWPEIVTWLPSRMTG